jgi:hypothetical protein
MPLICCSCLLLMLLTYTGMMSSRAAHERRLSLPNSSYLRLPKPYDLLLSRRASAQRLDVEFASVQEPVHRLH